jgi:phosphoglucosamine mutase
MQTSLFGTDGVRGKVNKEPMVPPMILRLGQAAAKVLTKHIKNRRPKIIIGKDTRVSGYIFEYALTSGLCSMGVDVYQVGPMPTPAIAHLVKSFAADGGIMISASHNPAGDNGIKFFGSDGYKLSSDIQEEIDTVYQANNFNQSYVEVQQLGKAFKIEDARGRYIEYIKQTIQNRSLKGYKIVLDCANGAAYKVAPWIFQELGAEVIVLNNEPDGLNINRQGGSEHPQKMQGAVLKHGANVGIALDGDADRIIMADEKGNLVDGDQILAIAAIYFKNKHKLPKDTVVTTIMANKGFDVAMDHHNVRVARTAVGDRHISETMRKNELTLGGEQSGHIIFGRHSTTGDGTLTGLQILNIMMQTKQPLSELARCMEKFPQVLINIGVKEKKPINECLSIQNAIIEGEQALGDHGRVLVRYSGTQNLCRVMVEGKDKKQITDIASVIKKTIQQEVGV